MLTLAQATDKAITAGATMADIITESELQARHVGTVPFNHMIRALNMHSWHNSRAEWIRLAGAMLAKRNARRNRR